MSAVEPNVPGVWAGFNQYETAVTLAVQDFLKPGDVFFDVGANLGGLSLSGSRIVGPTGQVYAFEVSPRIIPQLISNLQSWHATNVHVMPYAVWNKSNDFIELFFGDAHYADSVVRADVKTVPDLIVESLALDDVVDRFGQAPAFIKFDIEGAEFEALKGFSKTLEKLSPPMILELNSSDSILPEFLAQYGYQLFEADAYRPFERTTGHGHLINVLAIGKAHQDVSKGYASIRRELVTELGKDDWRADKESPYLSITSVDPGRYLLEYTPTQVALEDGSLVEVHLLAGQPWESLTVHIAPFAHLAKSYKSLPFNLRRRMDLVFRIKNRKLEYISDLITCVSLTRLNSTKVVEEMWSR